MCYIVYVHIKKAICIVVFAMIYLKKKIKKLLVLGGDKK